MKRSFTITNNFDRVELGDSRAVQISFTVTNETGRRVEVDLNLRADVKSLGWFSLEGGSSRLMAPKATEHVTVAINVPPKVPAQSASFHLDAASSEEPDEMFCEGPPAVLVVPPPVVRKRNIPWILIAGVMAILIVISVVVMVVRNNLEHAEISKEMGILREAANALYTFTIGHRDTFPHKLEDLVTSGIMTSDSMTRLTSNKPSSWHGEGGVDFPGNDLKLPAPKGEKQVVLITKSKDKNGKRLAVLVDNSVVLIER